jgi:hypothetical protein
LAPSGRASKTVPCQWYRPSIGSRWPDNRTRTGRSPSP